MEGNGLKRVLRVLGYYTWIPLAASILGCIPGLLGAPTYVDAIAVPLFAAALCILFRNSLDKPFAVKVYGLSFMVLLVILTILTMISSGNMESTLMIGFCWLVFPFAPIILIFLLMGQNMLLFITVLLTYMAAFITAAILGKVRIKKYLVPAAVAAVCIAVITVFYIDRPSVKYAGHGFKYMHGFSSTDFSDYMVYSRNSKLFILDHQPELLIENEEDMPILDGAEACYPLYAAFAKAVYKDIDVIEEKWLKESEKQYPNGKIVTFTNSLQGYLRLIYRDGAHGVDMFFGARPSPSQLREAQEEGVELEITPIGREAFVFFTEEDNPVNGLTSEQIRAIYHGDITNWSELGGKDQEIIAFQRPKDSGSQTMMEYFMGDISLKEPKTYERIDGMMGVIEEVAQYANEEGAVGYSFRYFLEELNQEQGVKMLSVDGVYPSLENIEDGSYPLTTNVCLITRKNEPNPYVQKMIDFILSEDGQAIVRGTGYAGLAGQ